MKYDGVIFDLDGTLLKSTSDHLEWMFTAVEQALEETNSKVDVSTLSHDELLILAGIDGYEKFENLCSNLGLEDERIWYYVSHFRARRKLGLLEEDLLHLVAGTRELLNYLKSEGVECAVVSNAPDPTVDEVVRFFDLASLLEFFRGVTDLDDFRLEKPNSFHLEMACAELSAEDVVYVGDSKVDVEAAERLGADSIIIGEDKDADYQVSNLEELKELFEEI